MDNDSMVCSFYLNPCFERPNYSKDAPPRPLPLEPLNAALFELQLEDEWKLYKTKLGVILSFTHESDAERTFRELDLARVLNGPVQVAYLPSDDFYPPLPPLPKPNKYIKKRSLSGRSVLRKSLVVRDVPWSIPVEEIRMTLQLQGIVLAKQERWRQHVRIEIQDVSDCDRLLAEGCNFYDVARFPIVLESQFYHHLQPVGAVTEDDVIQCFRCQGFWHVASNCRQLPRCVRCGEAHSIDCCKRPRNNPVCCNCSGAHHAAYKYCPIRKQMNQSATVFFTLSTNRPTDSSAPIASTVDDMKPKCLL